jgi:hypothetical protein
MGHTARYLDRGQSHLGLLLVDAVTPHIYVTGPCMILIPTAGSVSLTVLAAPGYEDYYGRRDTRGRVRSPYGF